MKEFKDPKILRAAKRIAKKTKLCNNCFGRQFARVSTGMTNQKRGEILRELLGGKEPKKCSACGGLLQALQPWAVKAEKKLKGIEFSSFLVGSKLSSELIEKEEELWESVGIEHCEPIKSELNRELGKLLYKKLKKDVDEKFPDVIVLMNLQKNSIEIQIASLFVYGKYKKLVRGIPQTKWDTYPITVEGIIAKPFMKASDAEAHALHAAGREDVDARCLDWRPFVFEMVSPKKRNLALKEMEKEINKSKKANVTCLRPSSKEEVRKVKAIRPDKTYRVLVTFKKNIKEEDIASLKKLVGEIRQQTPIRVAHRRADLLRKRYVKKITSKKLSSRKVVLEIRGEAGLYIKELVTGDSGRTSPSVAELMGPAEVKELDVIAIHLR